MKSVSKLKSFMMIASKPHKPRKSCRNITNYFGKVTTGNKEEEDSPLTLAGNTGKTGNAQV